jgi:hypothetical protein
MDLRRGLLNFSASSHMLQYTSASPSTAYVAIPAAQHGQVSRWRGCLVSNSIVRFSARRRQLLESVEELPARGAGVAAFSINTHSTLESQHLAISKKHNVISKDFAETRVLCCSGVSPPVLRNVARMQMGAEDS